MLFRNKHKTVAKFLAVTAIFSITLGAMADGDHDDYKEHHKNHHSSNGYYLNNAAYVEIEAGDVFKSNAEIEIKIPTKNAYGFEGNPQKPEEEKQKDAVVEYLRNNISNIVAFEKDLACTYQVRKIRDFKKSDEIEAKYDVKCKDDLRGKKVTIDFSKTFKNIQKVYLKLEGSEKLHTSLAQNNGIVVLQ